jgi:PAS domain S-box-containing protein
MVSRLLTDAGRDDLLEPARLLVSEVVTNALVHSGTPIDVSMAMAGPGVLVEVGDGSPHLPSPRNYAPTASTGRGLALLDNTADDWGVVRGARGKTVWFQLTSADDSGHVTAAAPTPGPAPAAPQPSANDAVRVELLNMPLVLHAAWQQHAEAVLREYLLASSDLESGHEPLSVHAAATDALAILAEQVPRPDIGADPDELMSAAVDPYISEPRVEVSVPAGSVPHFQTLDTTLNIAQGMAEDGELLVPVVQPELQLMRRWLCGQVAGQHRGVTPARWPPENPPKPRAPRALEWDPTTVTESVEPAVAADDSDLIVAVSTGALDLLGYEHEELLGQRLISIIPRRYRQAHLAGFTLHLLTGRGPLLDQAVVVPVLRRDGSEVSVELHVRVQRVEHGRSVFLATLRPTSM